MASSSHKSLRLKGTRVLIVDDNAASLDILKQVLGGFRISLLRECADAASARQVVATDPLDLILISLEMRKGSGLELVQYVRERVDQTNFTTPIIVLSTFTSRTTTQMARDQGANMVVSKPVSPAILLRRIEWIAGSQRPFVVSEGYCGPDRRFRQDRLPEGQGERRAEALALTAAPERELSQTELDSLFG